MALRKGMPFVRLRESLQRHASGNRWIGRPETETYIGTVPDCEIEAREVVQKALENSDEDIRDLLGKFMNEFCGQVRSSTGIQDPDNILCKSLVDFFLEYKVEFGIDITRVDAKKRTLRSALQQLDSFLSANHYSKKHPGYSNWTANIIAATQGSVNLILRAVREFLVEKALEQIDKDPAAVGTLPHKTVVTIPNTNTKPQNHGGTSVLTRTRLSPGHFAIQNIGPNIGDKNKAESGVALEKRTESIGMETKPELLLKRKSQLKSTQKNAKKLVQELAASQTEVRHLKDKARLQQCSIEELKGTNHAAEGALKRAATATASIDKMMRDAAVNRIKITRLKRKIFGHKENVRKAKKEREHAEEDMQETVGLKNAMREMLMVTGTGFKVDAIETAAKAIMNGKKPRSVVADMIRDGMA